MSKLEWSKVSRAQRWAAAATGATVLLGIVFPAVYYEAVRYDPMIAVTIVMTVAIIFTAAFAADSVTAFREAREAEYTPILDVKLSERVIRGVEFKLAVEIRNVGRGIAAGVEASIWWMEGDLVAWVPHRLDVRKDLLQPGDSTTVEMSRPKVRAVVQRRFRPGVPELVVEVRFRNALRREAREFTTYDLIREQDGTEVFRESIHPVPDQLTSLDAKQKLLDEVLSEIADEHRLKERGFELSGRVHEQVMQVRLNRDGESVWWGQVGVERPVYDFAESLDRDLPKVLERHDSADRNPVSDGDDHG